MNKINAAVSAADAYVYDLASVAHLKGHASPSTN